MADTLTRLVLEAARAFPTRVALKIADETLTYQELLGRASSTSQVIPPLAHGEPALVCIWATHRSDVYVGILASLLTGRGYVPLNPELPAARLNDMVIRSRAKTVLVPEDDVIDVKTCFQGNLPGVEILEIKRETAVTPPERGTHEDFAYLLFTSGSTGKPKGVAIRHRNAVPLIQYMIDLYDINHEDVCSQNFDLSFDLSVHSIFTCWVAGAMLVVPSKRQRLSPARYIIDNHLTVWYSVPSISDFMRRQGQLKPGAYPNLRAVSFCGEALSTQSARRWIEAAPNAAIDNHYGPTEASMSVTGMRLSGPNGLSASASGTVAIGFPYPGVDSFVVDTRQEQVEPGRTGELLLGGAQVADGYWQDQERTDAAFIEVEWYSGKLYRTGDRVTRPTQPGAPMNYVGRLDNQVKILGHRVELGEIESAAQGLTGSDAVAAVAWPPTDEGFGGVELFLGGSDSDGEALRSLLPSLLPIYMLPRHVHVLPELPLNKNGKIDRPALRTILEERRASE